MLSVFYLVRKGGIIMRIRTSRRMSKDKIIELLFQLLAEERNKNKRMTTVSRVPRPRIYGAREL